MYNVWSNIRKHNEYILILYRENKKDQKGYLILGPMLRLNVSMDYTHGQGAGVSDGVNGFVGQ